MSLNPTVIAIPVYFLLIGIELLVHRIKATKSYRLNDAITNINCGITSQVTGAFMKVFSIGLYTYIYEQFRFEMIENGVLTWVIAFIAYDFFYYWAHRMSHQVNLFWGGHSVHHQSEEYNLSVALRQSSTQIVWTSLFYTPMALVGIDPIVLLSVSGFNLLYQFWIHTESIDRLPKWFEAVMNTPSHHRVHHARNPKYIDKNHAGTFIIWDRMFGTFRIEEEKPTYGITKNLNSWNPVWANVAHYSDMFSDIKTIPKFSDKLKYVFKKPGWLPDSLGGYRAPIDVDKTTHRKYDLHAIKAVNTYVFTHYVILLVGTAFFLFNMERFDQDILEKSVMASLIILSTVSFGGLFESRRWGLTVEILRLFLIPVTLLYFFTGFEPSPLLLTAAFVYIFGSLFWLLKTRSVTSQAVKNS